MTMSEKDIIELAAQKAAQVTLETLAKQKKKERRRKAGLAAAQHQTALGAPAGVRYPCAQVGV